MFYPSADKHGVPREDALWVIGNPSARLILREDPLKVLYIGFDTHAHPREVIVDHPVWENGKPVCVHADTLTPAFYKYL